MFSIGQEVTVSDLKVWGNGGRYLRCHGLNTYTPRRKKVYEYLCVPKPKTGASVDNPHEFPEEFD